MSTVTEYLKINEAVSIVGISKSNMYYHFQVIKKKYTNSVIDIEGYINRRDFENYFKLPKQERIIVKNQNGVIPQYITVANASKIIGISQSVMYKHFEKIKALYKSDIELRKGIVNRTYFEKYFNIGNHYRKGDRN